MPWYRQYFWLLLFGGIILVTAIISFAMVCVCRNKISKSVRVRIQKSFTVKKRTIPTIVTENGIYHASEPSRAQFPIWTEKNLVSPPKLSVQEQRIPPQSLYPGYNAKNKNTDFNIPHLNDRYSNASYDSVGSISEMNYYNEASAAISENSISVLPANMYAIVQKGRPKQPQLGLYPEYYSKSQNTDSDKPDPNDRYSYASYDSVGSISNFNYYNESAVAVAKDREYVEVIPDGEDYDDVAISSPR